MPTTTFVWDPVNDCVISELDGAGATQAVYTNEPQQYGGVLSQRRGSTSSFPHADALGTTRLLTSTAGANTDTYLFDAWGNPVSSTGSTVNPFRWVGRYGYYTDSVTGLVYVRARMYAPKTAIWLAFDPRNLIGVFDYANNTPTLLTDPAAIPTTLGIASSFPMTSIAGGIWGLHLGGELYIQGDLRLCYNSGSNCTSPGVQWGGCLNVTGSYRYQLRMKLYPFSYTNTGVISGTVCLGSGHGSGGGVSPW